MPQTANPTPRQGVNIRVKKMKPHDLESMSLEELWSLHELVVSVMANKISAEKTRLDERLRLLDLDGVPHPVKGMSRARRPDPQVFPKCRNPTRPSETWAGRGKQLRWLTAQLRSGKKLDDFRIQPSSDRRTAVAQGSGRPNKRPPEGGQLDCRCRLRGLVGYRRSGAPSSSSEVTRDAKYCDAGQDQKRHCASYAAP
jgi:DNA-binding protein H-NS